MIAEVMISTADVFLINLSFNALPLHPCHTFGVAKALARLRLLLPKLTPPIFLITFNLISAYAFPASPARHAPGRIQTKSSRSSKRFGIIYTRIFKVN